MPRLPKHHYPAAKLRCVLPACDDTGEVGLGFNLQDGSGSVIRFRIPGAAAAPLAMALLQAVYERDAAAGVQSPISSGSPSVDGSVTPGQSQ